MRSVAHAGLRLLGKKGGLDGIAEVERPHFDNLVVARRGEHVMRRILQARRHVDRLLIALGPCSSVEGFHLHAAHHSARLHQAVVHDALDRFAARAVIRLMPLLPLVALEVFRAVVQHLEREPLPALWRIVEAHHVLAAAVLRPHERLLAACDAPRLPHGVVRVKLVRTDPWVDDLEDPLLCLRHYHRGVLVDQLHEEVGHRGLGSADLGQHPAPMTPSVSIPLRVEYLFERSVVLDLPRAGLRQLTEHV